MPAAWTTEDRSLHVPPGHVVATAWVDPQRCRLGSRARMSPEAVEKKFRQLLQQGDGAIWPPPRGRWDDGMFVVEDGRHELLAALMLGRTEILVAWLEPRLAPAGTARPPAPRTAAEEG